MTISIDITETFLDIETPDGNMQTFVAYPVQKTQHCVILYMDVFGFRDELFELAREFARKGVVVAIPDLFHCLPVSRFVPVNDKGAAITPETIRANDTTSLAQSVCYTRALTTVLSNRLGAVGTLSYFAIGYCMGGRHALAAVANNSEIFNGGMSVHGGRLVDNTEASPHLLVKDLYKPFHFACAADDASCPDRHILMLENEAHSATSEVTLRVHKAFHGWTFPQRWSYDFNTAQFIHNHVLTMMAN